MEPEPSLMERIRQLEEKLLQADVRRSQHALEELLADEFVEFASDGASYNKVQVIAALQHEVTYHRSLTNFNVVALAHNVVLATYRSTRRDETTYEVVESLRSSVWAQRNNRWRLVFHQGTRVAS
jgi:hypothetical protein